MALCPVGDSEGQWPAIISTGSTGAVLPPHPIDKVAGVREPIHAAVRCGRDRDRTGVVGHATGVRYGHIAEEGFAIRGNRIRKILLKVAQIVAIAITTIRSDQVVAVTPLLRYLTDPDLANNVNRHAGRGPGPARQGHVVEEVIVVSTDPGVVVPGPEPDDGLVSGRPERTGDEVGPAEELVGCGTGQAERDIPAVAGPGDTRVPICGAVVDGIRGATTHEEELKQVCPGSVLQTDSHAPVRFDEVVVEAEGEVLAGDEWGLEVSMRLSDFPAVGPQAERIGPGVVVDIAAAGNERPRIR